jgi:hypothetical protein
MKDLLGESAGEDSSGVNIPCNLLTVAATGNSSFLEDLLRVGMDPDVGDSKGRTALVSRTTHFSSPVRTARQCTEQLIRATGSTSRHQRGTRSACWYYSGMAAT